MKQQVVEYIVPTEDSGVRLDAWLTAHMEDISRARVQMLLAAGQILIEGALPKASLKLRGGEHIEVSGNPEPPPLRAIPEAIPLHIVYEDADISVIDKPAGMMVHAGAGSTDDARNRGTLVNALLSHYIQLSSAGGALRPGIVHRLDRHTSGLIIVARNDIVHARLSEMFSRRQIKKTYLALVHGWPKQDAGTINTAIGRDAIRRTRMTTRRDTGARPAISHYNVIERIDSRFGRFALLAVRIETGRTHQIRVHLSSIGHAVVGDTLYGAPAHIPAVSKASTRPKKSDPPPETVTLNRNFLHAAELAFAHPRTGERLELKSGLPTDLTGFLHELKG